MNTKQRAKPTHIETAPPGGRKASWGGTWYGRIRLGRRWLYLFTEGGVVRIGDKNLSAGANFPVFQIIRSLRGIGGCHCESCSAAYYPKRPGFRRAVEDLLVFGELLGVMQ